MPLIAGTGMWQGALARRSRLGSRMELRIRVGIVVYAGVAPVLTSRALRVPRGDAARIGRGGAKNGMGFFVAKRSAARRNAWMEKKIFRLIAAVGMPAEADEFWICGRRGVFGEERFSLW